MRSPFIPRGAFVACLCTLLGYCVHHGFVTYASIRHDQIAYAALVEIERNHDRRDLELMKLGAGKQTGIDIRAGTINASTLSVPDAGRALEALARDGVPNMMPATGRWSSGAPTR